MGISRTCPGTFEITCFSDQNEKKTFVPFEQDCITFCLGYFQDNHFKKF